MKRIKAIICVLLCIIFLFTGCSVAEIETNGTTNTSAAAETSNTTAATSAENGKAKVTVPAEAVSEGKETAEKVEQGKNLATDDTASVSDESNLEPDATVEQENISYDGSSTGSGKSLLGKCSGLTYYAQWDSRWANTLYTSTGNSSQTMKSSGCGPTAAAMLISSSKGAILPTTVASIFVENKFRTANNGTAWNAWPFVADYFGFDEYLTTTSYKTMIKYLSTDKNKDGVADYFIICSCGSGLFTTSGHYILLVADNSGTITVYDPYLYIGKFSTASRNAANVTVSGNSAFVSESNFKKYANVKNYWIFSNDNKATAKKKSATTKANYTRYVATKSANLYVRNTPGGNVIGTLKKGAKVTVTATSGSWSRITTSKYKKKWVSTAYLSAAKVSTKSTVKYKSVVGKKYKLKKNTDLYSKSSLKGTKYTYKKNTTALVKKHLSKTVDYVYIPVTGRYAYCKVSAYV